MTTILYTQDGRSVSLLTRIGSGGEGDIYLSPEDPLDCAKVYTKAMPPETLSKLKLMVENPPPDPSYRARKHHSICWPSALLYKSPAKNDVAGFLMPRIDTNIFQKALVYIMPDQRRMRFGGGVTWKHLVAAATNISSSVDAIHQRGYCIGDLNESNLLIAPNALISIIDCDSFQVSDTRHGNTYRSLVGKGEYSPPELMGKDFAQVDRTIASDSFSLAILLFQLLMEGVHPYGAKGRLVDGAPNPEAKILLGHFPHTMRSRDVAPPDGAPPFENLHPEIQRLFERCFTVGNRNASARPTAQEWYSVLRGLENAFKQCPNNANHTYFDHLRSCPWCTLKSKSGVDLFPPPIGHQVALDDSTNLLESLERRLEYLKPYVEMAFADGILTPEEEAQLIAYGAKLQVPPKEIEKLIKAEATKVQGRRGEAPGRPQLALSQRSFAFDKVRRGTPLNGRYVITNAGGGTLSGTIRASVPWVQPSQSTIDTSRHIQEHTFSVDTSRLGLGTSSRAVIEITSNAGNTSIEVSVSTELERAALRRWRKALFWFGALAGSLFGLALSSIANAPYSSSIAQVAGLVGAISFVVVCAMVGKWGGGIGGFLLASVLQTILSYTTMRGYSMLAWAEIASAFLFFWAKPLLVARLAGARGPNIWAVVSGLVIGLVIITAGAQIGRQMPHPPQLAARPLPAEDTLAGNSIGAAYGVQWTNAIGSRGAAFSAANSSRIEYPGLIPPNGTMEFWLRVTDGYDYDNYQLKTNQNSAMVFSSDPEGGDVTWPGTTKIFVTRRGDVSLWMATNKYDKPHASATEARKTAFRFGEWHALGFSYGSQGQFIMVDGKVVAADRSKVQTFGEAGNHQMPLDIPTIGETVSHFWQHHRYEGGFEGILAAFRVSAKQEDWSLARGLTNAELPTVGSAGSTDENPELPPSSLPDYMGTAQETIGKTEQLPTGSTLQLNTTRGAVMVRNFYLDNPPVVEGGDVAIMITAKYTIVYDPGNSSFWLAIKGRPFDTWQKAAEQALLKLLNIKSDVACNLNVTSGVIYSAGDPNDGKSFPLSFCASADARSGGENPVEAEQQIRDMLSAYANAVRQRDAPAVAGYYAPVVAGYFLQRDTSRAAVQLDFLRKFVKYPQVEMFSISDIQIVNHSRDFITARFDRRWDFRGAESYSGDETEQMIFQQQNGTWQIIADCDVGLHWTSPQTHLRDESECLAVGSN